MRCPNCGEEDPTPESSDNDTTTCPKCGHRFPIDWQPVPVGASSGGRAS